MKRVAVRCHGGKYKLRDWIISHFPPHRCYTECFIGGASVLLRKKRSYAEVINDLDGELVNMFAVMRDHGLELEKKLRLTPFARDEFDLSYLPSDDPIEQARRTIARSFMGFGSAALSGKPTGFRSNSNRSGTTPAHDWRHYPDHLSAIVERLQGVVIENRDAFAVMKHHDGPETLHYVDPPYVHSERSNGKQSSVIQYRHEMTDEDHEKLAENLSSLKGYVVLSGYPSALYERLYPNWAYFEKGAFADGALKRTERLWLNPACSSAISGRFDFAEAS